MDNLQEAKKIQQKYWIYQDNIQIFYKLYPIYFYIQSTMAQYILEFTKRYYQNSTNSYIRRRSMQEYRQALKYYQYIQAGNNLFRNEKQLSGLRNIGNTCYFSVVIQIIYHINCLRDYFLNQENRDYQKNLIKEFKNLFAKMMFSQFSFADPTALFQQINSYNDQMVNLGDQHDFNQYFVKTLQKLQDTLTINNKQKKQKKKFISYIFEGYMKQYINIQFVQKSIINQRRQLSSDRVPFGIISLDSQKGSLQQALKHFFEYELSDYKNSKGIKVKATKQIEIVQFPAILIFNLNRVELKQSKYIKSNNQFLYPRKLQALKQQGKFLYQLNSSEINILQRQLSKYKKLLQQKKFQQQYQTLNKTLTFLEKQQKVKTQVIIQGKFGLIGSNLNIHQQMKQKILAYIEKLKIQQKLLIEKIKTLQQQKIHVNKTKNLLQYTVFALIIHSGKVDSGHYFLIIYNQRQKIWRKYNDKTVTEISETQVQQISSGKINQNMNVSCIFYKQKNLQCDPFLSIQYFNKLKYDVFKEDQKHKEKIDQCKLQRIIKNYAQIAREQYLCSIEAMMSDSNMFINYFLDPVYYLISQKQDKLAQLFKLRNLILDSNFREQVRSECKSLVNFEIPDIVINIDIQYLHIQQVIKAALDRENNVNSVFLNQGINWLFYNKKYSQRNEVMRKNYERIIGLFLLKLCFIIHVKIQKKQNVLMQIDHFKLVFPTITNELLQKQLVQNITATVPSINLKQKGKIYKQQKIQFSRPPNTISISRLLDVRFKLWIKFIKKIQKTNKTIPQQQRIKQQELYYGKIN